MCTRIRVLFDPDSRGLSSLWGKGVNALQEEKQMTGLKGRSPEGILQGWEKCDSKKKKNPNTVASSLHHQSSSGQEMDVACGPKHGPTEESH